MNAPLFVQLGSSRLADCPGAGATGYGDPQPVQVTPGVYEIRVVGGPVVVKEGGPPVSRTDIVVVQDAPMFFETAGTLTLAAQTSTESRAYVTKARQGQR